MTTPVTTRGGVYTSQSGIREILASKWENMKGAVMRKVVSNETNKFNDTKADALVRWLAGGYNITRPERAEVRASRDQMSKEEQSRFIQLHYHGDTQLAILSVSVIALILTFLICALYARVRDYGKDPRQKSYCMNKKLQAEMRRYGMDVPSREEFYNRRDSFRRTISHLPSTVAVKPGESLRNPRSYIRSLMNKPGSDRRSYSPIRCDDYQMMHFINNDKYPRGCQPRRVPMVSEKHVSAGFRRDFNDSGDENYTVMGECIGTTVAVNRRRHDAVRERYGRQWDDSTDDEGMRSSQIVGRNADHQSTVYYNRHTDNYHHPQQQQQQQQQQREQQQASVRCLPMIDSGSQNKSMLSERSNATEQDKSCNNRGYPEVNQSAEMQNDRRERTAVVKNCSKQDTAVCSPHRWVNIQLGGLVETETAMTQRLDAQQDVSRREGNIGQMAEELADQSEGRSEQSLETSTVDQGLGHSLVTNYTENVQRGTQSYLGLNLPNGATDNSYCLDYIERVDSNHCRRNIDGVCGTSTGKPSCIQQQYGSCYHMIPPLDLSCLESKKQRKSSPQHMQTCDQSMPNSKTANSFRRLSSTSDIFIDMDFATPNATVGYEEKGRYSSRTKHMRATNSKFEQLPCFVPASQSHFTSLATESSKNGGLRREVNKFGGFESERGRTSNQNKSFGCFSQRGDVSTHYLNRSFDGGFQAGLDSTDGLHETSQFITDERSNNYRYAPITRSKR